jgi:hypothetical protein
VIQLRYFKIGMAVFVVFICLILGWIYVNNNSSHVTFQGESQHWKGIYQITGDNKWTNEELTLTFKGTEVSSDSRVHFSFETTAGGGKVNGAKLGMDRSVKYSSRGHGTIPVKSEVINVIVEWDGNKEVVQLKNTE